MDDGTVTATQFKADCLKLVEKVEREGGSVTVTRHGKPVAKLVPVEKPVRKSPFGSMKGTVIMADDLISPAVPAEEWDACR